MDEIPAAGVQVAALLEEIGGHSLGIEAAVRHQDGCGLVAPGAVFADVHGVAPETRIRLPGDGALTLLFVVAELEADDLPIVVPDHEIQARVREPAAAGFSHDLTYVDDLAQHAAHFRILCTRSGLR